MSEIFAALFWFGAALLLIEVAALRLEKIVKESDVVLYGNRWKCAVCRGVNEHRHDCKHYAAPANVAGANPNADVASQPPPPPCPLHGEAALVHGPARGARCTCDQFRMTPYVQR